MGNGLFSADRLSRRWLAGIILVFCLFTVWIVEGKDLASTRIAQVITLVVLLPVTFFLWDEKRFLWAGRLFALLVFLGSTGLVISSIYETWVGSVSWLGFDLMDTLISWVLSGLPCLFLAIKGRAPKKGERLGD